MDPLRRALVDLLATSSTEERQVILCTYADLLTVEETAAVLDMSPAEVVDLRGKVLSRFERIQRTFGISDTPFAVAVSRLGESLSSDSSLTQRREGAKAQVQQ